MQKALKQNNLLKISRLSSEFYLKAEREGFEPPVPLGTPVFKTGVIDHSTISPKCNFDKVTNGIREAVQQA